MAGSSDEAAVHAATATEEEELIGDTVGVALSGGGLAAVLVHGVRRRDALDEAWCRDHVRQRIAANSRFVPWAADKVGGGVTVYRVARVLSDELAERLIQSAEATAITRGGWTTARHFRHPTTDLPLSLLQDTPTRDAMFAEIREVIIPAAAVLFSTPVEQISCSDTFVVKYEAAGLSAGLEPHVDGSAFSFNLLLTPPAEFEGGGTAFEAFGWENALELQRGDMLLHRGESKHCGVAISSGMRYILVGFLKRSLHAIRQHAAAPRNVLHDGREYHDSMQVPYALRLISDRVGWGVIVTAPIAKDAIILYEKDVAEEDYSRAAAVAMLQQLPLAERRHVLHHSYGSEREGDEVLSWCRDTAAFFNHSAVPNCAPDGPCGEPQTVWRALRDIDAGEELLFDYGE
jgi:hypothetical protein